MTCFERVGGRKCRMFQLNARGEETQQLCAGSRLQDRAALPASSVCAGRTEAEVSRRGGMRTAAYSEGDGRHLAVCVLWGWSFCGFRPVQSVFPSQTLE